MPSWWANGDVAADDALAKRALGTACWGLRPNGKRLIAGMISF